MIIVNTGDGKGKTTAAMGQVLRSLGRGWKVCIIQLFKGREFYGEQTILKKLKGLKLLSFAPKHPACFRNIPEKKVRNECRKALSEAWSVIKRNKFDMVVLEEFNIAVRDGFLKAEDLLKVLGAKSPAAVVIVTGRGASKQLIGKADLVTEMKEIKHPYRRGITARKGIEF
ncbi:MAG: cob(I)yrinic acid a,c-diamide adenosyltransferase [Endomicrobiales bacterium]|nr:cob(I)yrinic acid a,c-diamide adenosyltransferase [Endomicrobiales bacterium]